MSKKYLINLDVNNTLLDTNYRSTSPTIQSVIEQLSNEGSVFVINSDRSLEDIQAIAQLFGINGPIIGENGAFIYYPENDKVQVMLDEQILIELERLKERIKAFIAEKYPNAHFFIADTTDINKHSVGQELPANKEQLFIMNIFRKFSVSVHVRKFFNDELIKDYEKAEEFCALTKNELLCGFDGFNAHHDSDYANLLVHPVQSDRAASFMALADKYPHLKKIFICDDLDDKPAMSEIDYFFAVGNASAEAKKAAHYVASETITKGVEEILLKMDELVK
jgi:hydroxymethylpyrimidine pyrophosphatase-like HAD family hydrolase